MLQADVRLAAECSPMNNEEAKAGKVHLCGACKLSTQQRSAGSLNLLNQKVNHRAQVAAFPKIGPRCQGRP